MEYWKKRFFEAENAFHVLKSMTKKVPAGAWCDNYRELAEAVHTLGRDVFYVDAGAPGGWKDSGE